MQEFNKDNFTPVNEVFARGKVLSVEQSPFGPTVLCVIAKVRRDKEPLILNFTYDVQAGTKSGPHLKKGDIVQVTGYTRAFTVYNDALKRETETMYWVATKVELDKPELAKRFGDGHGHFYGEPVFRSFVSGTVVKAERQNKSWGRITLATSGGGSDPRPSYPVLRMFTGGYLPHFDFQPGDVLLVRCSAFTPQRKKELTTNRNKKGGFGYFQNLIVEDFDYLYKVPRAEATNVSIAPAVDFGISREEQEQMEITDLINSFKDDQGGLND